jgi:hypothetical protein
MSTTQPNAYQSIQVCAMRVTRLSNSGVPLTGATVTNGYVAKAPVLVKISPDKDDGPELKLENGCGVLAGYYQAPDVLKKFNINFELTDLDAELLEILTEEPIVSVGGATVGKTGRRVAACGGNSALNGVAIEFWSKRWDSCSVPTGTNEIYWHWFMPWAFLQTGEYKMENDFMHIPIEGYLVESANFDRGGWTEGAWPDPAGLDACWGVVEDSFFPEAASGYQPVT